MKFLKHDTNKKLLALIIFFLILFIVYTVYYETILRKVLTKKNEYDEKLSDFTTQAIIEKLNKTDKLKEIAIIDKALLEERYYNLLIKNENLKKEKEALQNEVILLKSELEYNNAKLDGPTAQFRLIQDKNLQLRQLNDKISAICSRLQELNFSIKECK